MVAPEWYNGGQHLGPANVAVVDFGTGVVEPITITIPDGGVTLASAITATISVPSTRDADEAECVSIECRPCNIVPGVSFDVVVEDMNGDAEGQFNVNYTRS